MKKIIEIMGRFAAIALMFITMEGLMTSGTAFQFEKYNWVAYLAQICLFILCIWGTLLWCKEDKIIT